ncbi:unnamed protein product [Cochlearia groenlandica]
MRNKNLFFITLFFFFSLLVELNKGQDNRKIQVNVGVVTDVREKHSVNERNCINMSLSDFYSSRPQFQTRLVVSIEDSREDDVVGAAAAGFCIDFFEAVIREMPYDVSYEFIPFETRDGKPAGNHNDLVHQVYLGRFDAVVGDTTILANRSTYVDFTLPFIQSGVGLIVPVKDIVKKDKFSFLRPLSWKLWLTSFLSFFIIGFTVWAVEQRVNPDFRGPLNYQASTIFWFAFSTMVFAPRERVFTFGARVLVITWYFILLVLIQSYTASLASLLTSQQLHPTRTNMRSLLDRGDTVGYQRTSFIYGKLKDVGFSESSLIPFDTEEECDELLRKGTEKGGISGAFLGLPYLRLFLGQYCTYKMVEESFNVDGFGFVFPIGSPLVADVSRAILKVAESAKAIELDRAWFKKKDASCPDPDINPDPNPFSTSRQLGMDSFWVLFVVAGVMCVLTLGKFVFFFRNEPRENGFWKAFQKPDTRSYINLVEKCPCASVQNMPENPEATPVELEDMHEIPEAIPVELEEIHEDEQNMLGNH